jgi:hypothetical protein
MQFSDGRSPETEDADCQDRVHLLPSPVENRLQDVRRQACQREQPTDVGVGHALLLREIRDRLRLTRLLSQGVSNRVLAFGRDLAETWCRWPDSNGQPPHYECGALPIELQRRAWRALHSSQRGRSQARHERRRSVLSRAGRRGFCQQLVHGALDLEPEGAPFARRHRNNGAAPKWVGTIEGYAFTN